MTRFDMHETCELCGDLTTMYSRTLVGEEWLLICWKCANNLTREKEMNEIADSQVNDTRGFTCCTTCGQVMGEYVDHRGDSYYICPCGNKIRIFHRRIEPQRGINSRGGA